MHAILRSLMLASLVIAMPGGASFADRVKNNSLVPSDLAAPQAEATAHQRTDGMADTYDITASGSVRNRDALDAPRTAPHRPASSQVDIVNPKPSSPGVHGRSNARPRRH